MNLDMAKSLDNFSGPFYALALVALIVTCLSLASDQAVPIAVAVFIWVIINAFSETLLSMTGHGKYFPAWSAKTISILSIFLVILLGAQLLAQNITDLSRNITAEDAVLFSRLQQTISEIGLPLGFSFEDVFSRFRIEELIAWGLVSAQSLLSDISLVFLYVLFLIVDERFYGAKLHALIPDKQRREKFQTILGHLNADIRLYLWIMSLISLGVGLATYLCCKLVGLEGAEFWGILAFILNFVPTIGSIAAVIFPVIFALITLNDPVMLGLLIVGLAATQVIAGELILPRIMGDRLNLSSFVIIFMLVIWGAIWGPAGLFMAIPMTVILVMVLARFETTRAIAILLTRDGRLPHQ